MAKRAVNRLTLAQIERLAILSEECGEIIKAVGKILRHGYRSKGWSNKEDLERELGDIMAAVEELSESGDVDLDVIEQARYNKRYVKKPITHHQYNGHDYIRGLT